SQRPAESRASSSSQRHASPQPHSTPSQSPASCAPHRQTAQQIKRQVTSQRIPCRYHAPSSSPSEPRCFSTSEWKTPLEAGSPATPSESVRSCVPPLSPSVSGSQSSPGVSLQLRSVSPKSSSTAPAELSSSSRSF